MLSYTDHMILELLAIKLFEHDGAVYPMPENVNPSWSAVPQNVRIKFRDLALQVRHNQDIYTNRGDVPAETADDYKSLS